MRCGDVNPENMRRCEREDGHEGPHACHFTTDEHTGELSPKEVWV